ncbi:NrsF family protein [Ancylobacter sp. G4_0304]|uniref:NrsF family protein n=1 Tax=Ancylobacter sp. G4_0304 TaxID=3114289 RepID=UPI0039C71DFF
MRTEDLIRGLAADTRRERSLESGLARALGIGLAGAVALFALILAPRAGMPGLMLEPRVLLKFVVTLSLAAALLWLALRLVRPGADARALVWALSIPAGALLLGVVAELVVTPPPSWMPGLIGHNAIYCLVLVTLMAAPVLASMLYALKRGAPEHPMLAGAAGGALAGSLGAALYALHCVDDSPLFVLVWYGLAIGFITVVGALIGRRMLAW